MIHLLVVEGPDPGRSIPLPGGGPFLVGRSDESDLVLPDRRVSRHHARIERQGGAPVLVNTMRSNPTRLNGRKVSRALLSHGDRIRIADFVLEIRFPETVEATETGEPPPARIAAAALRRSVGPYRVLRRHVRGGMGGVYVVARQDDVQTYALKAVAAGPRSGRSSGRSQPGSGSPTSSYGEPTSSLRSSKRSSGRWAERSASSPAPGVGTPKTSSRHPSSRRCEGWASGSGSPIEGCPEGRPGDQGDRRGHPGSARPTRTRGHARREHQVEGPAGRRRSPGRRRRWLSAPSTPSQGLPSCSACSPPSGSTTTSANAPRGWAST